MKLTMPEEIMLLLLDDATGRPVGLPAPAADYAVAGAILMQLSLMGRVDTDAERLMLTSPQPTGDGVLDDALAQIGKAGGSHDSRHWILELGRHGERYRGLLLDRLVARGVLRREEGRFLWVFPDRRYPKAAEGAAEVREVRARLRHILLNDDIPDPEDALLIGLCRATGLIPLILTAEEQARTEARVDQVANLEELGRTLSNVTREVYATMLAFAGMH
jgi:hypothetical protein